MENNNTLQNESPWPHRLAMLMVCATFPLIWVGGLVTTYDAGMAVPDWPATYGSNLFLYPWTTWISGPWDLFIEHGHRLLGSVVGILAIAFVFCVFRFDSRRWMRMVALAALAAVIGQGVLGGARVLMDQRQIAMIHACAGPAFFAFAVVLAVVTSSLWTKHEKASLHPFAGSLHRLSLITVLLAYLQLILGAVIRHIPVDATPGSFRMAVIFHLLMAGILTVHVLMLLNIAVRKFQGLPALQCPALVLFILMFVQLFLGVATWVSKYSWPAGLTQYSFASGHTVIAQGFWSSMIVTAHVATGSLILATSALILLRSLRVVRAKEIAVGSTMLLSGVMA